MHAAVVELNALTDAVGAGAQDEGARALLARHLRLVGVVGLVVVGGLRGELRRAGVHGLEGRAHAEDLAAGAHRALVGAREHGDLGVGEPVALRYLEGLGVHILQGAPAQGLLHGDHVGHAIAEEHVDSRALVQLFRAHAAAQGLGRQEDALGRGARERGEEFLIGQRRLLPLPVGSEAGAARLQGTQGLAEGLLESAADGHDLAHGLHTGRERVIGALELLEGEAWGLHDAVVDGRLEAGRRGAGHVIHDLVQGVAHGQARRRLRDGKSRGLRRQGRGARHAGVHLDDDHAARLGVHGELHVGAARGHAHALEHRQRRGAHALVLQVGQRLGRGHGDGVAGVHAHGIQVLDGAHDDAVAGRVAHDLHLVFLPALDGLLHEHLAGRGKLQPLGDDADELILVARDAAAGAAHGERRAQYHGEPELAGDAQGVFHGVGVAGPRDLDAEVGHALVEEFAVLAALDDVHVAADELYAIALEHAGLGQFHGRVQARLAAEGGQARIGPLLRDDLFHESRCNGLHVGGVGQLRVGHDGGRVRVYENDPVALLAQHLAGLGAGVVELAGLADDDGAAPDNENALDVLALGHLRHLPFRVSSELPTGQAVGRDVDVQVVLAALHEAREGGEQVVGVGGPGGRLRVVLHAEGRHVEEGEALGGAVVEVHVGEPDAPEALVGHDGGDTAPAPFPQVFHVLGRTSGELGHQRAQALEARAEAVVLGRHFHAAGQQVLHRVVAAVMAELQLVDFRARGLGHHLVAQTDAEQRHLPQQLLRLAVGLLHRLRVARAVGEEHAVGAHGEHVFCQRVPGHDGELAATRHQTV